MIILTDEQEKLVNEAVDFYNNSSEQVFQYSGKAGTGKSIVMNAIIERLGLDLDEVAPMSYIGAAAIVMRLKGLYNAKTIHSWLYEPKIIYDYDKMDTYFNRPKQKLIFVPKELGPKKLICIDEAGSVPFHLKQEIERRNIKIIACGDLNQLPPVADTPAYLYTGEVHYLTQIMRQAKQSAIIVLGDQLLQGIPVEPGMYGNVLCIEDTQLTKSMLLNAEVVICGKNKTRNKFNKYIRKVLLGIDSTLPKHGERLICRKNNWQIDAEGINLANGLIGTVTNFPTVYGFDGKTFTIDFSPDLFNGIFKELKCNYQYFTAPTEEKDKIKKSMFHKGEMFELAYAITTHISQGSQYNRGIYYEEFMNKNINNHLNYTGITRFSKSCIYIIHKHKYY